MKSLKKLLSEEIVFFAACPAWLWQIFFVYMPLIMLLWMSLTIYQPDGMPSFSLYHYVMIFNSLYLKVILSSFSTALITTTICLLIAYPVAYYLALKVGRRLRTFLLFSVIFPSWTSLIVQIYAWFFLLDRNGFFCQFLYHFNIIPESKHLLNNYFAIIIGMVSCFLPFMILPIYAVLERIDRNLLEASADLGAHRFNTLRHIVIPLSLPGVYAGCLLVFIPSFGEFAIPTLLGGSRQVFWGNLIVDKFLRSRDWASGAALALLGILLPTLLIMMGYMISKIVAYYSETQRAKRRQERSLEPW